MERARGARRDSGWPPGEEMDNSHLRHPLQPAAGLDAGGAANARFIPGARGVLPRVGRAGNVIKGHLGPRTGTLAGPGHRRLLVKQDETHARRPPVPRTYRRGSPAVHPGRNFFARTAGLRQDGGEPVDDELSGCPGAAMNKAKVYTAAFKAGRGGSTPHGQPTVILANTIKGWTLGQGLRARQTHATR